MSHATADLIDDHADILTVCLTPFRQFGGRSRFSGPIRTVRVLEDNARVKSLLAEPGNGAVLVIDGGASPRTALVGDLIAASAVENGWSGIVVRGPVRDSLALSALDIGIKALGTVPAKSGKTGAGETDVVLTFDDGVFTPGHWLYSDEDGLVTSPRPL
jgi:regulator of ribonuclease activity A